MNRRGSIRDRIRELMQRRSQGPSRSPSRGPDNDRMRAMNDRINRPDQRRPGFDAGANVPGLRGVHFSPDIQTATQKAAESVRRWNSPDRMNHPAIGFSRSMAGIDNDPGAGIKSDVMRQLAAKGISRDDTGTYRIAGMPQTGTSRGIGETAISRSLSPIASNRVPGTLSNQTAKSPLTTSLPGSTQAAKSPLTGGITPAVPQTTRVTPSTGGNLADTIRNAMGIGPSQIPSGSSLADTIRQTVQAGLRPVPTGRQPITPPTGNAIVDPLPTGPPTPRTPAQGSLPDVAQSGLPVIPAPTRLPGSAVTGLKPDGTPRIPPLSTITPGTTASGQPITLNPAPTTTVGGQPMGGVRALPESMAPSGPVTVGSPQGQIPMDLNIAYGRGGDWATVNAYDAAFSDAGAKYGVDPAMLKAMMVIESGGQNIPNGNGFPNSGPMQLTSVQFGAGQPTKWDAVADKLGLDITNPEHQVYIAAYVLGGHDGDAGSPEDIFLSTYYPTGGLDVPGGDGHTPRQYLEDINTLTGIINGAAGAAPIPSTGPVPPSLGPVAVGGEGTTPPVTSPTVVTTGPLAGLPIDPVSGLPIIKGPRQFDPATGQIIEPGDPAPPGTSQLAPGAGLPPGMNVVADTATGENIIVNQPATAIGMPQGDITTGQDIVSLAMQGEGIAYGGVPDPSTPLDQITSWDCSGFTRWVLHNLGYTNIPMGSEGQYQVAADQGILQTDFSGIQEGDLVFYDTGWREGGLCTNGVCPNRASHVGIYIGNGQIIQAGTDGTTVESIQFGNYPILGFAHPGDYAPQGVYY
jgi:cell wall-associated NlpC family hydrolase